MPVNLALAFFLGLAWLSPAAIKDDGYVLFEHPGRMVQLPGGPRLSLYCIGIGRPTVILETGFGGGAYADYHKLQPLLGHVTRTCSYDRAGYGFSELGNDLPRDLRHDVTDLHALLLASGEEAPYILVGHSDGGHIIGAYADLYPKEVRGLVFLDAAVLVDKAQLKEAPGKNPPDVQAYFDKQLRQIRNCLDRATQAHGPLQAKPGDFCLDSRDLAGLPQPMADAVVQAAGRPGNWRAFLSEAEQHYLVDGDLWEESLLPHRWRNIPIRVFISSVASLDDAHSAAAYGIPASDHAALANARAGRKRWEDLQARICSLSDHCKVYRIPTAQHEVQNAVPGPVFQSIRELVQTPTSPRN